MRGASDAKPLPLRHQLHKEERIVSLRDDFISCPQTTGHLIRFHSIVNLLKLSLRKHGGL